MSNKLPLLGSGKKKLLFVVSAPAGTGKTTLVQMLLKEFPAVKASISCTTRLPRQGEIPGHHYYFLSEAEFTQRIASGDFLEYVTLFGHYYGTSKKFLERQQQEGSHIYLTIDTQGAMQLKGKIPAIFIFIRPPSLEELRRRLETRQTETKEAIDRRISWAEKELLLADEYDYQIINDDLVRAYDIFRSILIAEDHRVCYT